MIKLKKEVADSLHKIPRAKKVKKDETKTKVRRKQSWRAKTTITVPKLERTPVKDTVKISENSVLSKEKKKVTQKRENTKIGDIFTEQKRIKAKAYLKDLEAVAQEIPEATFFPEINTETAIKQWDSINKKLAKREDKYNERGYKEVIRDEIRARMFLPEADKNYQKVINAMEKKGYKISLTLAEDADGNLILDAKGKPKKVPDIDVRFGDKAQPSGYQDVQMRFEKNNTLYELIIMPGPHYLEAANKEHEIYDEFKLYDSFGLTRDIGAKQIIGGIKTEFGKVTRKLYQIAEQRDTSGSSAVTEPATFTPEGIKILNGLFSSLKKLFLGKFNATPPSKKTAETFKETKTSQNLNNIEHKLRIYMDLFKPKEEINN